ncbi:MAG: 23S rRNA (adenine(2503)-C(2))-methyltransferase RlmN [Mariprofundaceae bacterium]|nr:23S rRNA (adenine(2503)-C(2))-methyltransferase RlmN [Mariprofundaceae bacterium]
MSHIPLQPLYGLDKPQLLQLCQQLGVSEVHANTINGKVFRHAEFDIEHIPYFPQKLLHWLQQHTQADLPAIVSQQQSTDGTQKLLLRMQDGRDVESVLIQGTGRITQCISSQVGCAIGCKFCLTATAGLTRNLTTSEMISQVMVAHRTLGQYPRNIVLMGMGEPLHNYAHVAQFVQMLTDPQGMAFSPRRVTISTAGLVPAIARMIDDDLPCSLAVSLNATTDSVRSQIMPINQKYPLASLLNVMQQYIQSRKRKRIFVEYVMLAGINDSLDDLNRLIPIMKNLNSTINLLPFNPFPGSGYQRPSEETVNLFRDTLNAEGIVAVVRESKGQEISAACGLLKTEVNQRAAAKMQQRSVVS